jgi:site-specific recombinase XerC
MIKEFTDMDNLLEQVLNEEGQTLEDVEKTLQIDENYAKVSQMDTSADMKLSLLKRFVNWLTVEDEAVVEKSVDIEAASTESEVEADNDQMEDQMDIEILKDALNSVFDQKMTEFAASLKEEVEASVDSKIEEVAKSADAQREELEQKLAAAETALAEQTEKVEAFAAAGAVKKSVDPDDDEDGEDELVKSAPKPFWSNIYLPQELVKALGYES